MPTPDRALVVSFQSGDEDAFDEIFKRHHSRVAAVCYRMLGNAPDAEEAAQETFLKAYQALGRFNGSYYLGAWLGRIATNVCVDHLRARARTNLVALPEDREDLLTEEGPEDIVVGDHPRLHRAIKEIQPLHASALALRTLEGMSHQEIAGQLRMSPSQVKALLHRARSSLRRAWDKAEGWAAAPLIGLRHFTAGRGTDDAGRLVPVSHSAAPYLMEKMAASAMIVAAALTGLPSAPVERATTGSTTATPTESTASSDADRIADLPSLASDGSNGTTDASAKGEAPAADPVAGVLAQVEKAIETPPDPSPDERRRDDDRDDDDVLGPHAAEGDQARKKVKKLVNEVTENLAP